MRRTQRVHVTNHNPSPVDIFIYGPLKAKIRRPNTPMTNEEKERLKIIMRGWLGLYDDMVQFEKQFTDNPLADKTH